MYYKRAMEKRWKEISSQFPVLFLTGPRQVGKTTFLRHVSGRRRYVTLDDPDVRLMARRDPALFFRRFKPPVLIDEIQYAPDLMPYIKMQVDEHRRPGAFWLTGSQQFSLMRGITETLAGRVAIVNLLGFSGREHYRLDLNVEPFIPNLKLLERRQAITADVGKRDIFRDIWMGSFPALVTGQIRDRNLFYSSYLRTYLERDIRDLGQVGDEGAFLTFLKACAARTGQLLNLSNLARDANISVKTAKNWLGILQGSFQVFLLRPYHNNLTKRLVKRPKLYFFDTGLCTYLAEWASPEVLESGAMAGAILETYAVVEILKSWWNQGMEPSIHYYRDKDCVEADILFSRDGKLFPTEIKKAGTPSENWTKAFSKIDRIAPTGSGCVICLCKQLLGLGDDNYAVPVELI